MVGDFSVPTVAHDWAGQSAESQSRRSGALSGEADVFWQPVPRARGYWHAGKPSGDWVLWGWPRADFVRHQKGTLRVQREWAYCQGPELCGFGIDGQHGGGGEYLHGRS